MTIDWTSLESHVLCNPTYSVNRQKEYQKLLEVASSYRGHVWLSTSGSTSQKWVGLSKEALLASASGVNQHLLATANDRWVTALPDFHVGGLSIWARAYLSRAPVFDFKSVNGGKWHASLFSAFLEGVKGSLTSLVPAQLHDLIQLGMAAPPSLRAVIIGGGKLMPELYAKAVELGWPVLPSYGLTECASQVATAALGSWKAGLECPTLELLPHMRGEEQGGRLAFKGPSLLSAYAHFEPGGIRLSDPKVNGWLVSEDRGEIQGTELSVFGRSDACIKIGGESVDLACLEAHLQSLALKADFRGEVTLVALPDSRLGNVLHLAAAKADIFALQEIIDRFQKSVLPFEKIRAVCHLPYFPRSALSKILKNELQAMVRERQNVILP
ncbi:putative o-succinylbenzoate-CoA ligase [Candidatus Protochlamydia naegleriophila]|uniref:Putative o-succinylbenzoate-CoA ligase n=1 Tax=Candidatus Protochlamydia naegleriophila TaxID=389348 RepID=A0A0U5K2W1_9BACT|nr:AMP-binding protein [Candidatus Protochlamydia naegleriophila]CUI16443.1 putative o-succinylbenzoate-CoA ligase [Candidatus Protochlamydia naegleriophila]